MVSTRYRNKHGYAEQGFKGKKWFSHQLVAEHHLGLRPKGMETRHLCGRGDRGCVTPSHLVYGTRRENLDDRVRHGKPGREGRFTPDEVRQIRKMREDGHTYRQIQDHFGCGTNPIYLILKGRSYKWVSDHEDD